METTAEQVAKRFADGQSYQTSNGETLHTVALESGAVPEIKDAGLAGVLTRYEFPDGSVIVDTGEGWDLGYADCWCWQTTGHEEGCKGDDMETQGIQVKGNHKHWPKTKTIRPFAGCVGSSTTDCNPAAHGGISYRESCSCGASRMVNVNQFHRENGPWYGLDEKRAGIRVEMNPFGEVAVKDGGMIQLVISQQEAERLAQGILDLLQDEGQWK